MAGKLHSSGQLAEDAIGMLFALIIAAIVLLFLVPVLGLRSTNAVEVRIESDLSDLGASQTLGVLLSTPVTHPHADTMEELLIWSFEDGDLDPFEDRAERVLDNIVGPLSQQPWSVEVTRINQAGIKQGRESLIGRFIPLQDAAVADTLVPLPRYATPHVLRVELRVIR